jgi:hypothetical protein
MSFLSPRRSRPGRLRGRRTGRPEQPWVTRYRLGALQWRYTPTLRPAFASPVLISTRSWATPRGTKRPDSLGDRGLRGLPDPPPEPRAGLGQGDTRPLRSAAHYPACSRESPTVGDRTLPRLSNVSHSLGAELPTAMG